MEKIKNKYKLASFSLEKKVVDVLDSLPRQNLRNKSALVNDLIKRWLIVEGYIMSGSI